MSECTDPDPGSHEFWVQLVEPLCSYMADLELKDVAEYASILAQQKYQIRHMRKLTPEKLQDLGIAEEHSVAIIDSVQAFIGDFEARATEQLDEMTFTPERSDAYFQDLMAVSNNPPVATEHEPTGRDSISSLNEQDSFIATSNPTTPIAAEYEPAERDSMSSLNDQLRRSSMGRESFNERRGSINSIASSVASSFAAEEYDDDRDSMMLEDGEKPKPLLGDAKTTRRHELAMQKALKLAQFKKQKAEAAGVKPVAGVVKPLEDDHARARIAKQLAKAKSLGEARKHKTEEPGVQKIAPRPSGSGTIDEKTQARLAVAMEKARLLAAKRMNSGTMELPPSPTATTPVATKMDPKTQARVEKEMAKAKAMAAAKLAKLESEKVVEEIAPLPPPDAALTPEMQARLEADIARAKARAEAIHQKRMQQVAEEQKRREHRERPDVVEEDPRILEKRKQELEALKQKVAEREREKRNLKVEPKRPPAPPARTSTSERPPPPSKIVVSKPQPSEYGDRQYEIESDVPRQRARSSSSSELSVARAPMKRSNSVETVAKSVERNHTNNEAAISESVDSERVSAVALSEESSPRASASVSEGGSERELLEGEHEEEVRKRASSVDSPKVPTLKPKPIKKPAPPAPEPPARERINSADFYLSPLEVLGAAPQCMLCDAAPSEVYCEDCKESFCNVNDCNRDTHCKIAKARHYKRVYQVRKKLVSLLVNCYICGQQFSVASLAIHYDTCRVTRKLGLRELPANLRPPTKIDVPSLPIPDEATATTAEIKAFNEEHLATYRKFNMVPCPGCNRRFEPDRIQKHMKGCDNLKT